MVRHYSKRAATFMPDRSGAARMKRGDAAREGRNKCNDFKLVTPTGLEPVFSPCYTISQ